MPLYPFQVLRAKECAPTLCLSTVFCLGLTFGSLKELGARHPEPLHPMSRQHPSLTMHREDEQ
jgi:hypothetical protein